MRKFSNRLILALAALVNALFAGLEARGQQDNLFSTVRASTVFSGEVDAPGQTTAVAGTNRAASTNDLVRLLQQAEFSATAAGTRAASTTKQLDAWQFPVLVTISEDEQDLLVVLGLRSVSDSQKLPAPRRLLQLLETNQTAGWASFVYSRERGRLELRSLIRNLGDNEVPLRDEINRLAVVARDTASLWNLDEASGGARPAAAGSEASKLSTASKTPGGSSSPAATSSQPANPGISVPDLSVGTLRGRWAASRSATEAFAMQLNADTTFVLVSVINGRQSRSSGKFTLQNNRLSLEGNDGVRIAGMVKLLSASEFQFMQQSAAGSGFALSFQKAP